MMKRIKARLIKNMLRILNSRFLNNSPCSYGYIGNVDAFSYENLRYEVKARPDLTVSRLLQEADAFRCCPIGKNLTVIDETGQYRDATPGDLIDLRASFTKAQL